MANGFSAVPGLASLPPGATWKSAADADVAAKSRTVVKIVFRVGSFEVGALLYLAGYETEVTFVSPLASRATTVTPNYNTKTILRLVLNHFFPPRALLAAVRSAYGCSETAFLGLSWYQYAMLV